MKTTAIQGAAALTLMLTMGAAGLQLHAQSTDTRRQVRHLVTPQFPELAKKLNLSGTVRVEVTIAPDGTVKRSRILGGHPILAAEAEHAADKSTFEPGPKETTEMIEFKF
jgi:TonB family protein